MCSSIFIGHSVRYGNTEWLRNAKMNGKEKWKQKLSREINV